MCVCVCVCVGVSVVKNVVKFPFREMSGKNQNLRYLSFIMILIKPILSSGMTPFGLVLVYPPFGGIYDLCFPSNRNDGNTTYPRIGGIFLFVYIVTSYLVPVVMLTGCVHCRRLYNTLLYYPRFWTKVKVCNLIISVNNNNNNNNNTQQMKTDRLSLAINRTS